MIIQIGITRYCRKRHALIIVEHRVDEFFEYRSLVSGGEAGIEVSKKSFNESNVGRQCGHMRCFLLWLL